jgi:hypothetical protein
MTSTAAPTPTASATSAPERGGIDGFVWNDLDGDGLAEPGEPRILGATLRLRMDGALVGSVITAGDGVFRFDALLPGHYTVEQINLAGLFSSTPDLVEVEVQAGLRTEIRFGDWGGRRIWAPLLLRN